MNDGTCARAALLLMITVAPTVLCGRHGVHGGEHITTCRVARTVARTVAHAFAHAFAQAALATRSSRAAGHLSPVQLRQAPWLQGTHGHCRRRANALRGWHQPHLRAVWCSGDTGRAFEQSRRG